MPAPVHVTTAASRGARPSKPGTALARLPEGFSETLCPPNLLLVVVGERVHTGLYRQNEGGPVERAAEVVRLGQLARRWAWLRQEARRIDRGSRGRFYEVLDRLPQPPGRHELSDVYRTEHAGAHRGRRRPWWGALPGRTR